jgi:hypothetical protein
VVNTRSESGSYGQRVARFRVVLYPELPLWRRRRPGGIGLLCLAVQDGFQGRYAMARSLWISSDA